MGAVPPTEGAQSVDLLMRHLLNTQVIRLDDPIKRHFPSLENDPVPRAHKGGKRARVPIKLFCT
jgi:hypothetical protein